MIVGLSLSFCIQDLIKGIHTIDEVDLIRARTLAITKEHWEDVITNYRKAYWCENPEIGEALTWRLLAEDKIYQPRAYFGNDVHEDANIVSLREDGHWVDSARIPNITAWRERAKLYAWRRK